MSFHPLRGFSSSTELTIDPVENPSKWLPTVSNGGESKITSAPSTPSGVKADLLSDEKPHNTHQDKKQMGTSLTLEDSVVKPVTMLPAPEQQPGSFPLSIAGNEGGPLSDGLSTSQDYLGRLRRKGNYIPDDPPIVLLMQILLKNPQEKWRDISFPLFCGQAKQPIRVIDDGDSKYTLWLSLDTFAHDSFDEYACNFWINDSKQRFKSGDCFQPGKPDIFIPLGWLVQSTGRQQRTTLYVCLWNTSTEPNSVWLAYDYHGVGDCDSIDELDCSSDFDCSDYDKDSLRSGLELGQAFDQSFDKKKKPAQSRDQKTQVGEHDAKVSHVQMDSSPGYLGAKDRFDFGMVIHDVNNWDPSTGIAIDQARLSLASTSKEYGRALEAANLHRD